MTKEIQVNPNNEKLKHAYYKDAKNYEGFSDKTIECHKKAIYYYEDFTEHEDFKNFTGEKAIQFRESLVHRINPTTGKQIALSTVYDYLRYLKAFFTWLSKQTGYKSRIKPEYIKALRLSIEQEEMAIAPSRERYPSLEQIQKVVKSIDIKTEIDMRDRALICFTLLSAMRDKAIITLPLGCFDPEILEIFQSPKYGVKTKKSKTIQSYFFQFDKEMIKIVVDWYNYLKKEKSFSIDDPFFPKNMLELLPNSKTFVSNRVSKDFWETAGSMREIFRERFDHAGVEYFPPHAFRHSAIRLARKKCKNQDDFRALSSNVGHANMGTTFSNYGKIPAYQVRDIISGMDFTTENKNPANDFDLQEYQEFKKFQEFKRMQDAS